MKLSTKGRYAVMTMADIALNATGRPVPLADVASAWERQRTGAGTKLVLVP